MALMLLVGTSSAWGAITIYFDNTNTKWTNVYIYLYSSTYWDSNNGSGANGIKWCNNGQPMTHIGNNIYSFSYDGTHSGIVAFTEGAQCGYNNFWDTKACYSGTEGLSSGSTTNYSTSKPCFKPVTSGSFTKNSGKTTYYKGTWVAYAITYTISYDANGGTGAPADQTKNEGEDLTLSTTIPTLTGYTFTGWNTDSNGSGTTYEPGASYTTDADLTLYAQWEACPTIAEPAITTSAATVCEGTPVTLSNYNGNNANTVKWYSNSACTSEVTEQVILTDDKEYYAKAYDEASGCYSSEYSTLTFTVNPLPNISISGNNSAVLYEDVELTAATDGTSISWEITEGDGSLSSTTGNSVTLTSSSAGNVTVTATATLGSCTATDTHEVEFSAENCADVASNDIQITFIHPNDKGKSCQYWGLGKLTYYIGSTKHVHDFGNSTTAGAEGNLTIPDLTVDKITGVRLDAAYDYTQCTAYATITDLAKGYHYTLTLSDAQQNSENAQKSVTLSKVSLTEAPPITAPAAKTISVSTTDGEGNIIFSGQVVKTGCDNTNEYGFQYSSDEQTWTTVKVGENAAAGTAISNNTVNGLDGTYYVRAYITNDNSTQYGAIKEITVSTEKEPITRVTLSHVRNQAGDPYSVQELANLIYCVGDIVWFKLEQDGSNFQYYEWISYPGTGLEGMYYGGMFKLKITRSGNVGIRLRNDANVDGEGNPTWIESNLLKFNTHPEPTAPTISFATGTICSNDDVGATLELGATVSGQAYELWKYANDDDTEGSKVANVATLNCTENNQALQFSGIKTAGKYFVKTYYTAFCNTVTANSSYATLTVVNAEDVSISINPAAATTTPWMPVKLTISATDDYTLEVPEGVEFSQNGDICSVKIPLPDGATGGEGQYENVSFPEDSYTVTANLVSIGGEDNPCAVPAEATITLTPYVEECTIGH